MTKRRLISRLREIAERSKPDPERDHRDADDYLIEFIDDVEIAAAFMSIKKDYA